MAQVKNPKKDIHLYINNSPGHINIATAVQAFWKELGLNVQIKVQEWKQYLEFLGPPPNSDVDVYRLGWIYDYPDAQNGLVLWTCGSGNNNTNWCNKKYDALIAKANNTPNANARYLIYQQAESLHLRPEGRHAPHADLLVHVHQPAAPEREGLLINPMDQTDYSTGLHRLAPGPAGHLRYGQGAPAPCPYHVGSEDELKLDARVHHQADRVDDSRAAARSS